MHTASCLPAGATLSLWRKNTDTRYLPLSTVLCVFEFGYGREFVSLERVFDIGRFYVFLHGFSSFGFENFSFLNCKIFIYIFFYGRGIQRCRETELLEFWEEIGGRQIGKESKLELQSLHLPLYNFSITYGAYRYLVHTVLNTYLFLELTKPCVPACVLQVTKATPRVPKRRHKD